jgi:hypothetical protein
MRKTNIYPVLQTVEDVIALCPHRCQAIGGTAKGGRCRSVARKQEDSAALGVELCGWHSKKPVASIDPRINVSMDLWTTRCGWMEPDSLLHWVQSHGLRDYEDPKQMPVWVSSITGMSDLWRAGLLTLGDVTQQTESDLRRIRNLGAGRVRAIQADLAVYGLSLKREAVR